MSDIYLLDDHAMLRDGLRAVLEAGGHRVVGEAAEPAQALLSLEMLSETHRSAVLTAALALAAFQGPLHAQDSDPGTSYRYRVAGPVPPAMWLVLLVAKSP